MNSQDLTKYGFYVWIPLSEIAISKEAPSEPGVYILRLKRSFGRLVGNSDILYIGSTTDINHRLLKNFIGGKGGKTTQRIHYYLIEMGYLNNVEVSWKLTSDYKSLEKELLRIYEKDHHELPPWNRQK